MLAQRGQVPFYTLIIIPKSLYYDDDGAGHFVIENTLEAISVGICF